LAVEWMGKYRTFVEKIVKYGNAYAESYKKEYPYNTVFLFSAAQIQVLEYLLENEDKNQNMLEIAKRLGISKSAFSKHVKKMVEKGLLEKYHTSDNKKNIIIKVSTIGKEVYSQYVQYAYEKCFKKIFSLLDEIPMQYIEKMEAILDISASATTDKTKQKKEVNLILIEE
jgi:DNA-binding MarR family transcriptional regulator